MKTKEKRQSVGDCEETLRALEIKREQLIQRGEKLPQLRREASYAAHVEQDTKARRALDKVAAEVAGYDSELASLDAAIHEAKNRVLIAQAMEAEAAKRSGAKEAVEVIVAFKKAGHELDEALRLVADRGAALNDLLGKLHRTTGSNFPSHDQLDTLGYSAIMSALLRTPWAKRFRPMQPSQKRDFGPLFDGWSQVLESRIRPLLTEPDEEAA
jgi:hypothetical protein